MHISVRIIQIGFKRIGKKLGRRRRMNNRTDFDDTQKNTLLIQSFATSLFGNSNFHSSIEFLSDHFTWVDNISKKSVRLSIGRREELHRYLIDQYDIENINTDPLETELSISKISSAFYGATLTLGIFNEKDKKSLIELKILTNKKNGSFKIDNIETALLSDKIKIPGGLISFSMNEDLTLSYVSTDLTKFLLFSNKSQLTKFYDGKLINAICSDDQQRLYSYINNSFKGDRSFKVTVKIMNSLSIMQEVIITGMIARLKGNEFEIFAMISDDVECTNSMLDETVVNYSQFNEMMYSYSVPIFWKDIDGRYLGINPALQKQFQFEKFSDIIGKTDDEIYPPERLKEYKKSDDEIFSKRRAYTVLTDKNVIDGNTIYSHAYKMPYYKNNEIAGLISIIEITTVETKLKQIIVQNNVESEFIFENSENAYYIKDADLRFEKANKSLCSIFNVLEKNIVGKRLEEFSVPGINKSILKYEKQAIETKKTILIDNLYSFVKRNETKPSYFNIELTPMLNEDGEVFKLIAKFYDRTKDLETEKQLHNNYSKSIDTLNDNKILTYVRIDLETGRIIFLKQQQELIKTDDLYLDEAIIKTNAKYFVFPFERKEFMQKFSISNIQKNYGAKNKIEGEYSILFPKNNFKNIQIMVSYYTNPINNHREAVLYLIDKTVIFSQKDIFTYLIKQENEFIARISHSIDMVNLVYVNDKTDDFDDLNKTSDIDAFLTVLYKKAKDKKPTKKQWIDLCSYILKNEDESGYFIDTVDNKRKHITITNVDEHKKLILVVCKDITKMTKKDIAIQKRLKSLVDEAQRANESKSDFLARMSHDMRTPLTAIMGISDIALNEVKDEKIYKHFSDIKYSGKYLEVLLNDLLDTQNIENSKIVLNKHHVRTEDCCHGLKTIISSKIREKNISFVAHCLSKKPEYIYVDDSRISEVIINLLTNAIKYTPKNGNIEWMYEFIPQDDSTVISRHTISDNGIGMSEEFQKRMFDKFSMEENIFSKAVGGSGLGLFIVKKLVHLLGGSIQCSSTLNVGTTYTVELPMELSTKENFDREMNSYDTVNTDCLFDKKILICEDIKINSMIVQKMLSQFRIKTEVATDGKQGVVAVNSNSYDAVLMDIRMPVMNGLEAASEIRKFNKQIPIIALSANAYIDDIKKSISVGMNDHLAKPIDNNKLLYTLAKHISANRKS